MWPTEPNVEVFAQCVTEALVVARTDWTVLGVGEDEGVRVMGNVYGLVGQVLSEGLVFVGRDTERTPSGQHHFYLVWRAD